MAKISIEYITNERERIRRRLYVKHPVIVKPPYLYFLPKRRTNIIATEAAATMDELNRLLNQS